MDARLGGGIIDLTILPGLAVDRADVHYPSVTAGLHALEHRLGHVETSAEVGVDHVLPLGMIHPFHRRVASDSGVVDKHVDRAEVAFDRSDSVNARLVIGDVEFIGLDPGPVGEFLRPLLIAGISRGDIHPHVLERDTDRLTDTARPAGYHCHSSHLSLLFSLGS